MQRLARLIAPGNPACGKRPASLVSVQAAGLTR